MKQNNDAVNGLVIVLFGFSVLLTCIIGMLVTVLYINGR